MRARLKDTFEPQELNAVVNLVLGDVLHYSPVDVVLRGTFEQDDVLAGRIEAITTRLLKHEPLQYILGHARFHGHEFKVTEATLIPRPETELLVDMIVDQNPASDLNVIDLGTGSGCIAVSLARALKYAHVTAVDNSAAALQVAQGNARSLHTRVDFRQQDMLNMPPEPMAWDIVVSNPPYVCQSEKAAIAPNVLDYEPASALFVPDDDPLLFYRAIARYAAASLKPGGKLYLEINQRFGRQVQQLLHDAGLHDAAVARDQYGRWRYARATM
jgi:release factor glutamine methyltransferase